MISDERCPFWPVPRALDDVMEHCATEFDRQAQLGAHLIDITMIETVDGEPVERDYQYLETGS